MLLVVEKGIKGGICHAIYRCAKPNNKYMKNYDNNKKSSYIEYYSFLSERIKINKCSKLVYNLYDKETILFT